MAALINQTGGGQIVNVPLGLGVPWVQYVGRSTPSPFQASLAWGSSYATMTIDINFNDFTTAIPMILGSAQRVMVGSTPTISRTMPMRHPILGHMVAEKISNAQPIAFAGKNPGQPDALIPYPAYATFRYFRLTILYKAQAYNVIPDGLLQGTYAGNESARYVEWKRVYTNYALSRKGPDFVWASTSNAPSAPPRNQTLAFGVIQPLQKEQITLTWRQIPEASLFPAGPLGPSPNIESALGGVNLGTWNTYPEGVILFENFAPEPEEAPMPLADLGEWIVPQRLWRAGLSFRRFDPPSATAARGHNLMPWSDGLWYFVAQALTYPPPKGPVKGVLPYYDFSKIFQSN